MNIILALVKVFNCATFLLFFNSAEFLTEGLSKIKKYIFLFKIMLSEYKVIKPSVHVVVRLHSLRTEVN